MPLLSAVHVDQPLTNMAVEYINEAFIATQVMPIVPVSKKSDLYFIYDKKDRFSRPQTIRGPKAKANEVDWTVTTSGFTCIDYALAEFISDAIAANADSPIVPRAKTTEILTDLILLDRELRVNSLATTYANYASGYRIQLSGGNQLNEYATSDPIGVIDTAKAALFADPNLIIMGKEVYDKLKRHPQLLDHVKGGATSGDPAMVGLVQMAEIFEVDAVVIGKAKYNTANKGQDASFSYIWGKDIVVARVDQSPQVIGASWAKTFQWTQVATNAGYQVRTWREEDRGGGGEKIEVETSYDEKIVCSDMAYLVDTAIA